MIRPQAWVRQRKHWLHGGGRIGTELLLGLLVATAAGPVHVRQRAPKPVIRDLYRSLPDVGHVAIGARHT